MGVKKIILLFICILLITLAVPSVNASMVSISAQAKYRPGIEVTVNPGYSILNCVLSKYTIAIEEAGPLLKKINKNDAFGPGIDNLVAYTEVTKGNGPGMPFGLCGSRRNGHSGPGRHSRRLTNFALKDALGSVTRLTDSSGRVSHRYFYSPFGKSAGFGNVAGNPFTYTGRRLDPTGLLFYRSRYMIPGTGRFMQADRWGGSVWSPWQSHPFIYVNNNPMVFVDPYGLWSMSLRGVLNYTVGTFDGIGQSLLTIGTTVANNLGTTALVAAGVAAAPNLAIIAGAGMAGLALKDSITEFYERTLKGKDSSRAFGKILVDTAFFYLTAKNVPKAVANLKATMSALRESVKNLKNILRSSRSVKLLPQFDNSLITDIIKSSSKAGRQITKGAQAIAKKIGHAESEGYVSAFDGIKPTQANAEKLIKSILSNPNTSTYGAKTVDVYNTLGQGVRFNKLTNTFVGFIEKSLATR